MSKKNSIVLILLIFVLLMGVLIFFYFSNNKKTPIDTPDTQNTNLPFGNSANNKDPNISTSTNTTTNNDDIKQEKLTKIYSNPTSGALSFTKNAKTIIRFIDRASGNVYEYLPESDENKLTRVTNTTIPKIQEVVWSKSGENLIFRYLEDNTDNINSFLGKIKVTPTNTAEQKVGDTTGFFLTQNIKQALISPDGSKIFQLLNKPDNAGSYGIISSIEDKNKKQIFESSLSIWNILWPKDDTITFTTKPSYKDYGYLFFFNTQNLSFKRILGDLLGLNTLTNKDTSLVAYSKIQKGYFYLDIFDVTKKENKNTQIQTLTDKCVWSTKSSTYLYCAVPKTVFSGSYPDSWYQGLISFSDDFWMIDTIKGTTKLLYTVGIDDNADVDAFDLKISDDNKYLVFTNKNDLSLWLLDLTEETKVQQQ